MTSTELSVSLSGSLLIAALSSGGSRRGLLRGFLRLRRLRSFVDALNKYVVQLLGHGDLGMLKLGQGVYHHGVVIVVTDHIF